MAEELSKEQFKEKLENQYSWPALYMFKFIVPKGSEDGIIALFPSNEVKIKSSNKGNYISVTAKLMMASSEEIIRIYEEAYKIKGVISL